MAGRVILETPRLVLREFDDDDVEAYYRMGIEPELLRYTNRVPLRDREHALEMLRSRRQTDYQKRGYGRWACVLKASGEVIGFCGPRYLEDLGEVEIGYRLLTAYWGRGLATEAAAACLAHGFGELGLSRIIGLVDPENGASIRVLEKIGMIRRPGQIEHMGFPALVYELERPG